MIQGLRTVIYPVNDLTKGKEWYAPVTGRAPYFDEPFYVGFSVGGFELGLIPDGHRARTGPRPTGAFPTRPRSWPGCWNSVRLYDDP